MFLCRSKLEHSLHRDALGLVSVLSVPAMLIQTDFKSWKSAKATSKTTGNLIVKVDIIGLNCCCFFKSAREDDSTTWVIPGEWKFSFSMSVLIQDKHHFMGLTGELTLWWAYSQKAPISFAAVRINPHTVQTSRALVNETITLQLQLTEASVSQFSCSSRGQLK